MACVHVICSLGMICSLLMSMMIVLVVHGLIMLFAPSLSLIEYMMSMICILTMFFLTTLTLLVSIKADLSLTLITKSVSSANQCCIDRARMSNPDNHEYCSLVSERITSLQSDVVVCSLSNCSLDSYGSHLVSTLLSCAHECFPTHSSFTHRRLVGWNQSSSRLEESSLFWHKICPSSGVLSQIKNTVTRRYRYAVRCLIRRQNHLLQKKLATSFARKNKSS